jgi:hypothetical protein
LNIACFCYRAFFAFRDTSLRGKSGDVSTKAGTANSAKELPLFEYVWGYIGELNTKHYFCSLICATRFLKLLKMGALGAEFHVGLI